MIKVIVDSSGLSVGGGSKQSAWITVDSLLSLRRPSAIRPWHSLHANPNEQVDNSVTSVSL